MVERNTKMADGGPGHIGDMCRGGAHVYEMFSEDDLSFFGPGFFCDATRVGSGVTHKLWFELPSTGPLPYMCLRTIITEQPTVLTILGEDVLGFELADPEATLPGTLVLDVQRGTFKGRIDEAGVYTLPSLVTQDAFGVRFVCDPVDITVVPFDPVWDSLHMFVDVQNVLETVGYPIATVPIIEGGVMPYTVERFGEWPNIVDNTAPAAGAYFGLQFKVTDANGLVAYCEPFTWSIADP